MNLLFNMTRRLLLALIIGLSAFTGCQRSKDVAPVLPPPFPPAKLPAYEPITVSVGALAAVKSAQGSVVNLTEIDTDIVTDPEFRIVWTGLLNRAMIGVRQADGDYIFCPIVGIDEYYNDGETASIKMTSGDKFEGQPILARAFGKSATGEVSIAGPQINLIKFSPGEIEKRNAELMKFRPTNWWEGWKQKVDVTMGNDAVHALENIAVIGFYTGCDQMWIPCKPFTRYGRYRSLLIKNGDFRMEPKLEDIAHIEIASINAAQGSNQDSANGIAKLRNGESINFTTWFTTSSAVDSKESNWVPLGFMGTDEKGMIHAFKFKSVKTIAFK